MDKKKRDRILIILTIIMVLCSVILAGFLAYNKYKQKGVEEAMQKDADNQRLIDGALEIFQGVEDVNQEQLLKLADICRENPEAIPVLQHFSSYPDRVIKMIIIDTDTIDYVLDYLDNAEKEPKSDIDISEDVKGNDVPLFIQWDKRWGYYSYGSGVVGYTACGPTCLSMIYTYLTKDYSMNPYVMSKYAKEHDYVEYGVGTRWTLYTTGAKELGLNVKGLGTDKNSIIEELNNNHPIICSVGPGDFTDNGHFIVLKSYNDGKVYVNDPNSYKNSKKEWNIDTVMGQMKSAWSFWK